MQQTPTRSWDLSSCTVVHVRAGDFLPFHGHVVWLTSEQGGRQSGPPPTPPDQDYAATAFVPPATVDDGLASFVLRVRDRTAWRSRADGCWLVVENVPPNQVGPGDVIVVTEGARTVAYFHVDAVDVDIPTRLVAQRK
ncbi:hypothetical protein CBZ_21520 [Cellulomonas biazotea]|uniref:Uncharacterized protein n=1 Tax=Cellulomonas biazotea TaxID=1709 RepID=A0A402DSP7_9CELL|nr:hypothetical protein CBZ_21520 [Cellulomonas biazotea]